MNRNFMFIFPMVVAVAFLLSACGAQQADIELPPDASSGDLELKPCEIEIETEQYAADCGLMVVPENRSDRSSRLIALPITRIKALGDKPAEPIFYLEGGPGASNQLARPPIVFLENHDFVLVGYRGVDGSAVLDCPEVVDAIKGDGVDALSAESLSGMSIAMDQCAARLESEGVDLAGYSIEEVVHDLETARTVMGYGPINLVSFSYGTRVAQVYANIFPKSINRSAMVSVNPPGHFVWEADMIDRQIEHYAALYAASDNARTTDLGLVMKNVAGNMPARWLGFRIDPGKVKSTTFAMLFHRNTAAMVFDAYLAAFEGDASGLWLMSAAYDFVIPSMSVWGEFFSKGVSADYDPRRDYLADMTPDDSIIGSPMSLLIWGSATIDDKVHWPTPLMSEELRSVQPSAVETLLVSGNVDFSTPAEYATDELLPSLSNGTQVILKEFGHVNDVMLLQPAAAQQLLTTFFETGGVDDSGFRYAPMNFDVGMGFPDLAKIFVAVVIILVVLLGLGVRWIVRRLQA